MPTNTADNWDPIPITAEEAVWEPRVFLICELLRSSNMDVSLFFTRLMSSKSKRLKEKQRSFIENKGFEKVFEAMLSVMSYNTKKKQNSTASILELKQKLGVGLWRVIQQILESEMKAYCKQPEAESRRPVQSITPELAIEFDFKKIEGKFKEFCPRLSNIIQGICLLGESDGDETMREGEEVVNNKRKRGKGPQKKRNMRDRSLMTVTAMSIMAFSNSRLSNTLQTPLGYYFQACGVPKKVISFLNRVGLSVAYTTICESMKAMGAANREIITRKVKNGSPIGLMWDNNIMFENKASQSVKNVKTLTQYTCTALWFLNVPKPVIPDGEYPRNENGHAGAGRIGDASIPDTCLGLDNPTDLDQKISEIRGVMEEGADRVKREAEWRTFDEKMNIYDGLMGFEEGKPGLEARKLVLELLSKDSYAEYVPARLVVHLSEILWKHVPAVMKELDKDLTSKGLNYQRPSFEEIHKIYPVVMDVYALDTMEKDETSISGTGEVIEELLKQTGLDPHVLAGRTILHAGDLGTMLKVSALKQLWIRDFKHNQLNFLAKLDAIASELEASDFEDLEKKLKKVDNYVELCTRVVQGLFVPRTVRLMREKAELGALAQWKQMLKDKKKKDRLGDELDRNAFVKNRVYKDRDLVYENALLFLQHYLVIRDLHYNISCCDSGALMKNIEPLCVWFVGGGKHHYAKATANLLIDKEVVWTEEFKYIWYNNILVNLCGRPMKFMGIDKSKDFFLKAVSQNAFLFNTVKNSMDRSAHLSDLATRHGSVDDKDDCQIVIRTLLQYDVMRFKKGRSTGGSVYNAVEIKPALDLFCLGERVITREAFLDNIMAERVAGVRDDNGSSECSEDRAFREEEERYMRDQGEVDNNGDHIWLDADLVLHNLEGAQVYEGSSNGVIDAEEMHSDEENDDINSGDINYGDIVYDCSAEMRNRWREGGKDRGNFEIDPEESDEEPEGVNDKESGSDAE
ncbi:hypothetical protein L211DRAFT_844289 [Terfezia boudieri ATCC MYA-4762]|uniref:DUF6589 domain-containing protein n=1 Tax=Terfezia boudieri ATCC MYA-4762 TaxID=1051890 RepID=A0A3N4M636_9PEZI|nr:hypothetical protein L211DRAFT_844289 [Terfezia boudieri ATCC MYA-4762]